MRQRRETPEPWAGALARADIRSVNHLAERTGLAVQTIVRLIHGEGQPSEHTITTVAAVLKPADARLVPTWAGKQWKDFTPELPEAARQLTRTQWAAVVTVIEAMAEPQGAEERPRLRNVARRDRARHQEDPKLS